MSTMAMRKRCSHAKVVREEFAASVREGLTGVELARRHGVSKQRVRQLLDAMGLETLRVGVRGRRKRPVAGMPEAVAKASLRADAGLPLTSKPDVMRDPVQGLRVVRGRVDGRLKDMLVASVRQDRREQIDALVAAMVRKKELEQGVSSDGALPKAKEMPVAAQTSMDRYVPVQRLGPVGAAQVPAAGEVRDRMSRSLGVAGAADPFAGERAQPQMSVYRSITISIEGRPQVVLPEVEAYALFDGLRDALVGGTRGDRAVRNEAADALVRSLQSVAGTRFATVNERDVPVSEAIRAAVESGAEESARRNGEMQGFTVSESFMAARAGQRRITEGQTLSFLGSGLSQNEFARKLGISAGTVSQALLRYGYRGISDKAKCGLDYTDAAVVGKVRAMRAEGRPWSYIGRRMDPPVSGRVVKTLALAAKLI